mgnify:CR=1 FL=1
MEVQKITLKCKAITQPTTSVVGNVFRLTPKLVLSYFLQKQLKTNTKKTAATIRVAAVLIKKTANN